jgi:glycosyltransferase involved in cell wall biosynthesis
MPPVPGGGREEGGGGLRDALDLGSGPVIGAVGTVRPEKALDRLVRAAAILRPRHPGLTVLIAGDGELRPLEALARELGLGSAVRLLGYRSDVSAILETMDVAVNCSIREGTPLSMMEYMDAGLPVVASRVGGVPDLLAGGEAGVLVDTANPEELAGAIAGLLEDPAGAKSMGERGRERRRREFGLETMARRVEDLYEELLQAKRAAGG